MDNLTFLQINYITIAPNRRKILQSFENEDYQRPIQIAKKLDLHPSAVSNNLKKLRDRGYVYLMNPDYHIPRLYKLTEKGKRILNYMDL